MTTEESTIQSFLARRIAGADCLRECNFYMRSSEQIMFLYCRPIKVKIDKEFEDLNEFPNQSSCLLKSTIDYGMRIKPVDPRRCSISTEFVRKIKDVCSSKAKKRKWSIEIDIKKVRFDRAPKFLSTEHRALFELLRSYEIYFDREKFNRARSLKENISALESTEGEALRYLDYTKEHYQTISAAHLKRIKIYREKIRRYRKEMDDELLKDRMALLQVIEDWEGLQKVRQLSGFISTSANLHVFYDSQSSKNEYLKKVQVELEKSKKVELELFDGRRREALDEAEKQKIKKMEAKEKIVRNIVDRDISLADQEIKNELKAKSQLKRRPIGEPDLMLRLLWDGQITEDKDCPKFERQRRSIMSKTTLLFEVYMEEEKIGWTKPVHFNQMFTINQKLNLNFVTDPINTRLSLKMIVATKSRSGDAYFSKTFEFDLMDAVQREREMECVFHIQARQELMSAINMDKKKLDGDYGVLTFSYKSYTDFGFEPCQKAFCKHVSNNFELHSCNAITLGNISDVKNIVNFYRNRLIELQQRDQQSPQPSQSLLTDEQQSVRIFGTFSLLRRFELLQSRRPEVMVIKKSLKTRVKETTCMISRAFLKAILNTNRPLNPQRKIPYAGTEDDNVLIYIKIMSAAATMHHFNTFNDPSKKLLKTKRFVEVKYSNVTKETMRSVSFDSVWNEEICFLLKNDETQSINFNIFDETDTLHGVNIEWRAVCKVPISLLLLHGKLYGNFDDMHRDIFSLDEIPTPSLRLNMFIALYPCQEAIYRFPLVPTSYKVDDESYSLVVRSSSFLRKVAKCTKRRILTPMLMFCGQTGDYRLIQRMIRPIELRIEDETSFEASRSVAKTISLLAVHYDRYIGHICDSTEVVIRRGKGDPVEISIAFLNHLLGLGRKAWLLIGPSCTEAKTALVLSIEKIEEEFDFVLWNIPKGKCVVRKDSSLVNYSIDFAINQQNIWANIQTDREAHMIDYDFNSKKHWLPFFAENETKKEQNLIYAEALLNFEELKSNDCNRRIVTNALEKSIEERIAQQFANKIASNNIFRRNIRNYLETLERSRFGFACKCMAPENVKGYCIHFSSKNINDALAMIEQMKTHLLTVKKITVLVYLKPYDLNLQSIWVFIGGERLS